MVKGKMRFSEFVCAKDLVQVFIKLSLRGSLFFLTSS